MTQSCSFPNPAQHQPYQLPDHSVGESGAPDPLESYSWQDLREIIYEDSPPPMSPERQVEPSGQF